MKEHLMFRYTGNDCGPDFRYHFMGSQHFYGTIQSE